jgi:hypothetical protein
MLNLTSRESASGWKKSILHILCNEGRDFQILLTVTNHFKNIRAASYIKNFEKNFFSVSLFSNSLFFENFIHSG